MDAAPRRRAGRDTLVVFTSDNGGERFSGQLAPGGRQDGPDRRRHPRALDCPLARRDCPGGTSTQTCMTMDWSRDDARRRRRPRRQPPAGWRSLMPLLRDATWHDDRRCSGA